MKEFMPQQPDYYNDGKLQFVTGYTGGGYPMCVHLTYNEYVKRIAEKVGAGIVSRRKGIFYWTLV